MPLFKLLTAEDLRPAVPITDVLIVNPPGDHKWESRAEAAKRLRQIADKLESDPAVCVYCRYDLDSGGPWEIHTDWIPTEE